MTMTATKLSRINVAGCKWRYLRFSQRIDADPDTISPVYHIFAYVSYMQLVRQPNARTDDHLTASDEKEPDAVIGELGEEEEYTPNNEEHGGQKIIEDMQPFVTFMDPAFMLGGFSGAAGVFRADEHPPFPFLACHVLPASDRFVHNTPSRQAQLTASLFASHFFDPSSPRP